MNLFNFKKSPKKQANIFEEILYLLPKEFIRKNQAIPLNYDNKTIVVGMVNPDDKKVLNDIIFFTGLKPTVIPITEDDFYIQLKKFNL